MDFKAVLRDLSVAFMAGSRPAWATLLLSVVVGACFGQQSVSCTHSSTRVFGAAYRHGVRIVSAASDAAHSHQ